MAIRNELRQDEDEHEAIDESPTPVVRLFLNDCFGVRLRWRGQNDKHIAFDILGEDDGYWFISQAGGSSSYWVPDLIEVITEAQSWLVANGEPDMHNGRQYGYKVRE